MNNADKKPVRAGNYSEVKRALAQHQAFKHTTMSGRWSLSNGEGWVFEVLSYRTVVAWAYRDRVEITEQRYSVTTSKHVNLARAYLTPWA